jgi:putative ATPase
VGRSGATWSGPLRLETFGDNPVWEDVLTGGLFDEATSSPSSSAALLDAPLAEQLRPQSLSDIVGQDHLLRPDAPLGRMAASERLLSMILWGPPGCGKTTLARLLAARSACRFVALSAVFSGVSDLRKAFEEAKTRRAAGQATLLFVDEIHRFNRAQQDSFLPFVEDGTITLVGATTENPSFELNGALLSRVQVFVLHRLDDAALEMLLVRAEAAMGRALPLHADARAALRAMADGDGRYCLNLCETVFAIPLAVPLDAKALTEVVQRRMPLYDKAQDAHYNLISALHKSLRGSDTDAALYWYARMLDGGEDPRYIARRLVRFAAEDVGMADPAALSHALAAWQAYERLGSPEGELALAQLVIYLGSAPKSNAAYKAFKAARARARQTGSLAPPKIILNAPTALMRHLGYGNGYAYDHDEPEGFSGQDYFPDGMPREQYYEPVERGFEREVRKRLSYWARLRAERRAAASVRSQAEGGDVEEKA